MNSAKCTVIVLLLLTTTITAQVTKKRWGTAAGEPVDLYTLSDHELTVRITTYGARIVSIDAPDSEGKMEDVVLGHDTLDGYEADHGTYFGAIVGRYGNRIANGKFSIDGKSFNIPPNDNGNALHGGPEGFDRKVWSATPIQNGIELTLVSPDGDMGFPGTLAAHVKYTLKGNSLRLDYSATTTKPTVVNLTNHSYFNLNGNGRGSILRHLMTINADRYTPVQAGLIPTGELAPIAGTPFDFRKPAPIGTRIGLDDPQLKFARGYDHNFVLDEGSNGNSIHLAAVVRDPETGRTLRVTTTEPGVQFYSGNFLNGHVIGKFGIAYPQHAAFCLETQHFPNSPNETSFPSTILRPWRTMRSTTIFTFGVDHKLGQHDKIRQ